MRLGKDISFHYTDKLIKVKGWIYLFDEKNCYVVVNRKTKLGSGVLIHKNTFFPFLRTSITNLIYH